MPAPELQLLAATCAAATAAAAAAGAYATFAPRARLWCPVLSRGDRSAPPRLTLTFDDGPSPDITPRILDTLAAHGVPAAFFVIGRHAQAHPALLRRIHAEGHILGNHTFDHHHLGLFGGRRYWLDQLRRTDDLIADATGAPPALFRPPMGYKSYYVAGAARALGLTLVTWTRRGLDGIPTTPDRILARLLAPARAGDIIALHDGLDPSARWEATGATAEALDPLIRGLKGRGFEFVRLDEFLGIPAYRATPAPPEVHSPLEPAPVSRER